ncbi:MAG TPA: DUF3145 domain-containing protein [Dermatophilaceae bacterium]|nr:DUF3145 domain-containing protein [Dermatophilaceae bacterium]
MSASPTAATRGVVFVHGAPSALCPHIGWALESVLGARVHLEWTPQPLRRGLVRTEISWTGEPGTGARLASALRGWSDVRYEVTEEPTPGADGGRWSYTPSLGMHHAMTSASGDAVVGENRLRAVLERAGTDLGALRAGLDELLGGAWDRELEPFRYAGQDAPVRWLHKVG